MNISANLEAGKKSWNSYSTKKKYLIVGGALFLLASLGSLDHSNRASLGAPAGRFGQGFQASNGTAAYIRGYGQPQNGQGYQGGYGSPPRGGGYATAAPGASYNHPDTTDLTSSYDYRNAVEDRTSHNFQNYQLDRTDVQNVDTGEVTNGVSNAIADPAIAGGNYQAAPAAPVAEPTVSTGDDGD